MELNVKSKKPDASPLWGWGGNIASPRMCMDQRCCTIFLKEWAITSMGHAETHLWTLYPPLSSVPITSFVCFLPPAIPTFLPQQVLCMRMPPYGQAPCPWCDGGVLNHALHLTLHMSRSWLQDWGLSLYAMGHECLFNAHASAALCSGERRAWFGSLFSSLHLL